ncbi:MAG: hypothetical protein IH983_07140 [Planctomycetes bacterium]|nr:hypothetical protein [Planctomycetota bacterium]
MAQVNVEDAIETIRGRVFRIQTIWPGGGRVGTAFYIADCVPSGNILIATARHLLEFPEGVTVRWLIERFDENGQCLGELHFKHDDSQVESRPYRYYKHADVGYCVFPRSSERAGQLVPPNLKALRVMHESLRLTPGTRVGWAGFPGQVEQYFRRPLICCFAGTVSAWYAEGSRGLYIVDGHNARGVSGGPVWHYPEDRPAPEVAGIVSGYGLGEQDMPGFCVFEPINPIISFLKANYGPGRSER